MSLAAPPPYDELDPGIREVVRFLHDRGFRPTDSGDGKSKLEHGWALEDITPFPHVACVCDASSLVAECNRMRDALLEAGVPLDVIGPEEGMPSIQGSYDPCYEREVSGGLILLSGVDGSMLQTT